MTYRIGLFIVGLIIVLHTSCKNDVLEPKSPLLSLPTSPLEYANVNYPNHIQQAIATLDNTPITNPITNDGASLGRVLFYDKSLSMNNKVSCASCHRAADGFSDRRIKSEGFEDKKTRRNSMPLLNVRFYKSGKMFWDERTNTLEEQVLLPIQDHIEMGMDLGQLITKLEQISYYPTLFEKAFGSEQITPERIAKGLAQFIRAMITYRSKYDQVLEGAATFTATEQNGKRVYDLFGGQQGCQGCHGGGFLDVASYHLQMGQTASKTGAVHLDDLGLYEVSQMDSDSFRFKVSTLRNIEMTAPYLHDGSVADLLTLFSLPHHNFGMTRTEINDLIEFLKTLTDYEIIQDERFLDPFEE
ncbi:cytochrome-c peroxidase [Aureispira anguillae]|nr:cytochrome-c peroxidase [Aureispira anguillae]